MVTKLKVVRAIRPNVGGAIAYERKMLALIDEMSASIDFWATVAFREAPPLIAQDAKPVSTMQKRFRKLGKRWLKRFDEAAPKIAGTYLKGAFNLTDSAMRQAMKDAGWTVKFQMTPVVQQAYEASLAENIGLIRSIPQQYLQQAEGIAMRSFTAGRDLQAMVTGLRTLYPKAANRAVLISRDQSNKATAVVTRARQQELGIIEAYWQHSNGGKHPRPSHVAASGKRYKIEDGCLIDGEYIFPGQKIGCRCVSRSILPGF